MKRLLVLALCLVCAHLNAGDAAVLCDEGFSFDGNFYVFGQYGKRDKTFQSYADIFVVDIQKNDFVPNAVFHTPASVQTASKPSYSVFNDLLDKSRYCISTYKPAPAHSNQVLYILEDDDKAGSDPVSFTDFEKTLGHGDPNSYNVVLLKDLTGSGTNCRSSFAIHMEKKSPSGVIVARQTFGSPTILRRGVTDYKITKIVFNEKTRAVVFFIEKTLIDATGVNIRYMVECGTLNEDFI